MKNNPTAFVLIVAVIRITAVFLILAPIYSLLSSLFQLGMNWGISGFILVQLLRPFLAAIALWFLARPIGKIVLRDFDGVPA
jgi:hypothetical protein